jgi:hypothetical protein
MIRTALIAAAFVLASCQMPLRGVAHAMNSYMGTSKNRFRCRSLTVSE